MRVLLGCGVALALTACDGPVPDSGVGFDNGNFKPRISDEPLTATTTTWQPAGSGSSETLDVLQAKARPQPAAAETGFVEASPSNPV